MQKGAGFTRLTADGIVNEGQTLLFGIHIEASTAGGDVSLYEGNDSQSGRLIGTFKDNLTNHEVKNFNVPVYLDRGLFVDIGSNVTAITVFWLPVRNEGV